MNEFPTGAGGEMAQTVPNPFKVLFVTRDTRMMRAECNLDEEGKHKGEFIPITPEAVSAQSVAGINMAIIDLANPELDRVAHRVHRAGMDRDFMTPMLQRTRDPVILIRISFVTWCLGKKLITKEKAKELGLMA